MVAPVAVVAKPPLEAAVTLAVVEDTLPYFPIDLIAASYVLLDPYTATNFKNSEAINAGCKHTCSCYNSKAMELF
jgi:hypothetical protein